MAADTTRLPGEELVGQRLEECKVERMTEVYRVDFDGLKTVSLGVFRDPDIAKAYAGQKTDADYHRTAPVIMLTMGNSAWRIGEAAIELHNDEQVALQVRDQILSKLKPEERAILRV